MAIENFTKGQFEDALPAIPSVRGNGGESYRKPLWTCQGYDDRTHQYTYIVVPFPNSQYALLVYSSIQHDQVSSQPAGGDSIRAVITHQGKPYGGKHCRWIPRTSGWRKNLLDSLRSLANQIKWLDAVKCPVCGNSLVPFTANSKKIKPENKGRGFVSCPDHSSESFNWTEGDKDADGKRPMISPTANTPSKSATAPVSQPTYQPKSLPAPATASVSKPIYHTNKQLQEAIKTALDHLKSGDFVAAEEVLVEASR